MKLILSAMMLVFSFSALSEAKASLDLEAQKLWQKRHVSENATKAMAAFKNIASQTNNPKDYLMYGKSIHFYGTFVLSEQQKKERIDVFTECLSVLDKAQQNNPYDLETFFTKGLCYAERAKSDRSLSDAKRAKEMMEYVIQKDYRYAYAFPLTLLGKLYFEAPGWPIAFGKNKTSLRYLREAMAINPHNRYNYMFLTEVLWDEGEKQEAREIFQKGLNLPLNKDYLVEDQKCLNDMLNKKKKFLE